MRVKGKTGDVNQEKNERGGGKEGLFLNGIKQEISPEERNLGRKSGGGAKGTQKNKNRR